MYIRTSFNVIDISEFSMTFPKLFENKVVIGGKNCVKPQC